MPGPRPDAAAAEAALLRGPPSAAPEAVAANSALLGDFLRDRDLVRAEAWLRRLPALTAVTRGSLGGLARPRNRHISVTAELGATPLRVSPLHHGVGGLPLV